MFYICEKGAQGKLGVKDTTDGVVEYYSRKQIFNIVSKGKIKILGAVYDYFKKDCTFRVLSIPNYITSFDMFAEYFFIPVLKRNVGSVDSSTLSAMEDELRLETRFLGGFGAWSGNEDLCDADILDISVHQAISRTIMEFEKSTGVKVEYTTGEKAWTYFYFK